MALPTYPNTITAAMINKELGRAETASFNLNDSAVRALAGKPSGVISFSDLHGKSSATELSVSFYLTWRGFDDWGDEAFWEGYEAFYGTGTSYIRGHVIQSYILAGSTDATSELDFGTYRGNIILPSRTPLTFTIDGIAGYGESLGENLLNVTGNTKQLARHVYDTLSRSRDVYVTVKFKEP